ncbi:MAG TPA: cytochrome c biogenesis protein CcdA [Acidimicrobiia bacterium]|nr:cytochrome c biogenesis protein CcdA [Acidimicrobiia bacterium]
MEYLLLSFFAGMLTVASPCVLPLLPVVLGGSAIEKSWRTPSTIIASVGLSIIAFTLLLKVSTIFLGVDDDFWLKISGVLISVVGLSMAYPKLWDYVSIKFGFVEKSHELQNKSIQKKGILRNILLGVSLGPIFSSCSPTYGIILATVLPSNFAVGLLNIVVYDLGLVFILGLIALGGQRVIQKLSWVSNSDGLFRRGIGFMLVLVGLLIATGLIRDLETWWAGSDFNFIQFEIDRVQNIKN